LRARVESIVNQSYRNIELTVIDDCSQDDSDEILRALQGAYGFHYFRRDKNSGTPFSAWEYTAAKFSDGLVWICESDDFAEPDFVERGVEAFRRNNQLALFYCNSWVVDDDNRRTGSTASYFSDIWKDERWTSAFVAHGRGELADYQYRGMTVPNMSSALMSAEAFRRTFNARIKRFKLTGDWLFVGELMPHGDVAFTPEHLSNFRTHGATARAGVGESRSQAEFILTKFRLHLLAGKKVKFLGETLRTDFQRHFHEKSTARQVLKEMMRVSARDTLRLLALMAYALYRCPSIFQDLNTQRKEIRSSRP
jgi:glycosyltransferase involved in cell wall biosynthesis